MTKRWLLIALLILASALPALYDDQGQSEGSITPAGPAAVAGQKSDESTPPEGGHGKDSSPVQADPLTNPTPQLTAAGTGCDVRQDTGMAPQQATKLVQSSAPPTQSHDPVPAPPVAASAGFNAGSAMHKEMLAYINEARAGAGLAPLILDDRLCECAGLKSQDMACHSYFNHSSPTYGSPFEMMSSCGIRFGTAGENIAQNFGVKASFEAFMNSDGHRSNILNRDFRKVGLGFYRDSRYLYVTQMFTD